MRMIAALLVLSFACSGGGRTDGGGGSPPGGGGTTPPPADRCDGIRAHVQTIYRAAHEAADPRPEPALAADLLEADVAMVMADCAADPDRVAPCAARARDAAEIEQTCLIPLDDEGVADGDRLGGKTP